MNLKFFIKILPVTLLMALAFNFIHSEIIDQLEGNNKCEEQDYCILVQILPQKTAANDNLVSENVLIGFLCSHCIEQNGNIKLFYERHQNFSFYHLEIESKYILHNTLLI